MGIYFNPGNSGFQEIVQSEYVEKTERKIVFIIGWREGMRLPQCRICVRILAFQFINPALL